MKTTQKRAAGARSCLVVIRCLRRIAVQQARLRGSLPRGLSPDVKLLVALKKLRPSRQVLRRRTVLDVAGLTVA